MVGTRANAILAASDPNQFILTREGSSRDVYLIDGIVYKVAINEYFVAANEHEYLKYQKARKAIASGRFPESVRVPRFSRYVIDGNVVLAADYIVGDESGLCDGCERGVPFGKCTNNGKCMPADIWEAVDNAIGWYDCTLGNAILSDGIYYLVDIAA